MPKSVTLPGAACPARPIEGDLVIDVPQDVQVNAQSSASAADTRVFEAIPPPALLCRGRGTRTCTSRSAISTG